MEFQKDDLVSWGGCTGLVNKVYESFIYVDFPDCPRVAFYSDGKYKSWHKEPSLVLIERPKKKVKKTFYFASWKGCSNNERFCTDLNTNKSKVYNCNSPDYQEHEICIEVDE